MQLYTCSNVKKDDLQISLNFFHSCQPQQNMTKVADQVANHYIKTVIILTIHSIYLAEKNCRQTFMITLYTHSIPTTTV